MSMTKKEAIEALGIIRIFDAPKLREALDMAISALRAETTADGAIVQQGRWVMDGKDHCHCSECRDGRNIKTQIGWHYCPNCGAKMD